MSAPASEPAVAIRGLTVVFGGVVEAVEGRLVAGREDMLQHDSQTVIVGAMTLPNLLARLEPEATVIMPGDRTEMIPGLLLAQSSGSFPQLAGLILTGGYRTIDLTRLGWRRIADGEPLPERGII